MLDSLGDSDVVSLVLLDELGDVARENRGEESGCATSPEFLVTARQQGGPEDDLGDARQQDNRIVVHGYPIGYLSLELFTDEGEVTDTGVGQ